MAAMNTMLISVDQVLRAYIRTGLKPLYGAKSFAVDAKGRDLRGQMYSHYGDREEAVAACPIGVLCIDKGLQPFQVETGSFGEYYYNKETHEGNICWADGFISAWEEAETGSGWEPESNFYTPNENPEGLALYGRGYANGQHIRQAFINMDLRAA